MKRDMDILKRAISELNNRSVPPGPPRDLVDDTLERVALVQSVADVNDVPRHVIPFTGSAWRIVRFAVAAAVLIATGYTVGRVSAPREPNIDELSQALIPQLAAYLEPAIAQTAALQAQAQSEVALAGAYDRLSEDLTRQYRYDLQIVANQTLAASTSVTNRLLTQLLESIDAAQAHNNQWFAAALEEMERNRQRDTSQLGNAVVNLAAQTESEFQQTRRQVAELLSYTEPMLNQSENPNRMN